MELAINQKEIETRIYSLRGVQIMPDKDLADFYQVKSIRLREQVKRNRTRFPEDFMVQLTEEEVNLMVSQNAIPSRQYLGGYLPYVFTEQGVAALSAVLKSERAVLMKHNEQYPAIEIKTIIGTHDRFLLIDTKELYHIGASLKDLGKKWFAFSRMDDFANEIVNRIKKNHEQ